MNIKNTNVGLISLGCSKNQVDSEIMLGLLDDEGYSIVNNSEDADIIIVNTCGFIEPAKEESIETIFEQSLYKKNGRCKKLIVTGCLSQRYGQILKKEIPEIDCLLGVENYTDIIRAIKEPDTEIAANSKEQWGLLESNPNRILTTMPGSAFLKIAEGCDNHCTYCVIPSIRGRHISRSLESLLKEAQNLADNGVKELVLISQDITKYGGDLSSDVDLVKLLEELVKIGGIRWIRLLYLYPDGIDDRLLELIKKEKKICKYLDIPFQHISDSVLRAMNRKSSQLDIKNLLSKIREYMPDITIRSTFITGFPGESQEDFEELKSFIDAYSFNFSGIFSYSKEEGTIASELPNQIDDDLKEKRRGELMLIQQKQTRKQNLKLLNKTMDVLIQNDEEDGFYIGRSEGQAPSVDGLVYVYSDSKLKPGDFVKVKIKKAYNYDLVGEYNEFS